MKRQFCEEECILYSADFQKDRGIIAGGTVFRAILIWSISSEKVIMKLEGHGGVIFDVKF